MKIIISPNADVDGFTTVLGRLTDINVSIVTKDGAVHEGVLTGVENAGGTAFVVLTAQPIEVSVESIETVTYL